MKALILAAGHGTRLGALTRFRPKPMLPIAGRPLLSHLISWLWLHGVEKIAVNLHHAPHVITDYLDAWQIQGVEIVFSREEELMGSAGAVKSLEAYLNEPFIVVYGDVFTNLDLGRLIAAHRDFERQTQGRGLMTMSLYRVAEPTQCGIVALDPRDRIVRFLEKPKPEQVFSDLAFSGVLVCEPGIMRHIPVGIPYDFGLDLFPKLMGTGNVVLGKPLQNCEYCQDIGTLEGYLAALRRAQLSGLVSPSLGVEHRMVASD